MIDAECNKLGYVFMGCLEREQRSLAEELVTRNINHLQLVEECFRCLLANALPSSAAREFVLRFLEEGEQYFLRVLIDLLVEAPTALKQSQSTSTLVEELSERYRNSE